MRIRNRIERFDNELVLPHSQTTEISLSLFRANVPSGGNAIQDGIERSYSWVFMRTMCCWRHFWPHFSQGFVVSLWSPVNSADTLLDRVDWKRIDSSWDKLNSVRIRKESVWTVWWQHRSYRVARRLGKVRKGRKKQCIRIFPALFGFWDFPISE